MQKRSLIIISSAIGLLLLGMFAFNYFQQQANEKRMAAMQRELAEQKIASTAKPAPNPAATPPLVITGATSQGSSALNKELLTQSIIDNGYKLLNQRNPDSAARAAAIFQEGIDKVDPENVVFYNGLGRSKLIAGKPAEAVAAWKKGIAINPKMAEMHSGIGRALWDLGDFYASKKSFEEATALDPQSVDAWSALAWIYMDVGDFPAAIKGFQVLIASDKQNMAWVQGLNMARAHNNDPKQIKIFFKVPPPQAFDPPQPTPTSQPTN